MQFRSQCTDCVFFASLVSGLHKRPNTELPVVEGKGNFNKPEFLLETTCIVLLLVCAFYIVTT